MTFRLGKRSIQKLEGVEQDLVDVVVKAIQRTKVDFGCIYGLRTEAEQAKLYAAGKSQTMKSKHLDGRAVDLMAYWEGQPSWELNLYDDIADAMKTAAKELGTSVRWGAAWHIDSITDWDGPMEDAMMSYIDLRRSQGRRPFIDGPHFELT